MAMDELSSKLGEATALSDSLKKSRDAAVAELESVKAAKGELAKRVDALSKQLIIRKDESTETTNSKPPQTTK